MARLFWYNQRWYDYTGTTLEEMRRQGVAKALHDPRILPDGWIAGRASSLPESHWKRFSHSEALMESTAEFLTLREYPSEKRKAK